MSTQPRPVARHRKMANAAALVAMCKLLMKGNWSQEQLKEQLGLSPYTVVKWLRLLRSHPKAIFIAKYVSGPFGQPTAYWTWGNEPDAKRPPPMTQAQYNERSKIRKKLRAQASSTKLPMRKEPT